LSRIARPVVALLTFSANVVLRLLGRHGRTPQEVTEEDIVYLTREATTSGAVEAREEEFIERVFRFTDRPVNNIMTPRHDIVAVEVGTPLDKVNETFLSSGHSRLPLYENTLDNVVGVLYAKDLLRANSADGEVDLQKIAHVPFFISEYQHIDDLLTTFRRKG